MKTFGIRIRDPELKIQGSSSGKKHPGSATLGPSEKYLYSLRQTANISGEVRSKVWTSFYFEKVKG
jgi:hypothetical protein